VVLLECILIELQNIGGAIAPPAPPVPAPLMCFDIEKNCLKGAQIHSFSIYPNEYGLDLSKEVLLVLPHQRAAKIQAIKVCADRDLNPGHPESSDLLYKVTNGVASDPKGLELFLITNFEGPYLRSCLS